MSSKSDRIRGFDELDPSQFAEPSDKAAELADELSRQQSAQGALGLEGAVGADGRRIPGFSEIASQLTNVHRDIRKARNDIFELEARGDTEEARRMRDHLDRLRTERNEVLEAMADRVTPIKRTGQWRFIDKSPADIRHALVKLAGFKEAAAQLERENPGIGQQAGFVLLDELTPLIRDGRLPVTRDFWRRQVLDKPVLAEEESAQSLSSPSVSGYDVGEGNKRDTNNMPNPEHRPDDEAQAAGDSGNELSEELRELIPDSATPRSPLDGVRSTGERPRTYSEGVQDFIRRQRADASSEDRVVAADTTPERIRSVSETDAVESRMTAEFGGQTFERGDKVLYESDSGNFAEYYILCNSIGDPPGLVVQSAENEALVFAIGADTEAHRVRRINSIEDPSEQEPPGPGGPPEGPPNDHEREGGEPYEPENLLERIPTVPTAQEILSLAEGARLSVDAQIKAIAQAKENREKLFGRSEPRQEALDAASQSLESVYSTYMSNWSAILADYQHIGHEITTFRQRMLADNQAREEAITRLEADQELDPATRESRIALRREKIAEALEAIDECDRRLSQLQNNTEAVTRQVIDEITLEMAQTRSKIETAQSELKEGKLSQKFKNLWRSKGGRRARLAIGVGLGIGGFLLGGAPGIAMMAGTAAMRGAGGYMGTEAGWNMGHNWRANRSDKRDREAAWMAQSAGTQQAADREYGHLGERYGSEMSETTRTDIKDFLTRHAGELYHENVLRGALAGDSEAAALVAQTLLSDQLDRVKSDAKSNRRAKAAGVAVGTALAALGLARYLDRSDGILDKKTSGPRPTTDPTPPTASPESYDPRIPRMVGVHEIDPNTPENWQSLHEYAAANPAAAAAEAADLAALDRAYEAASAGMSRPQLDQLNGIIGIGARTIGNEEMTKIIEPLANNVRSGMPTEKILELYELPKPPVS